MLNFALDSNDPVGTWPVENSLLTGVFYLSQEGHCYCTNANSIKFMVALKNKKPIEGVIHEERTESFNLKKCLSPQDVWLLEEHLHRCVESKDEVITVIECTAEDESRHRLQITTVPDYFVEKGYLTILQDLSTCKGLQGVFSRMEELNLVGKIAGSVAHEVRNPLTVVRGHLQLLSWEDSLTKYYEKLETMILEIDRAVEILTELLYMSRPTQTKMEEQNINEILNKLFQLLNAEALINLQEIEYELEDVPDVMLDKKKFRQVVLNLVNNGLQAMEKHGKVIVRTYAKNGKVFFSVTDHGKGIPQEIVKKLGTPFVSTKPNGTGLGLASCYTIVSEHKAKIEVDTGPQGTTFTIIFDEHK